MQKIKKAFISLIIVALIFNVLPFKLFADGSTYYDMPINTCVTLYRASNNSNYSYWVDGDARAVILNGTFYLVAQTNINYKRRLNYTGACDVSNSTAYHMTSRTINNITYYSSGWTYTNNTLVEDVPIITDNEHTGFDGAYYFTYGDGVVEPVSFGDLQELGFYTKFTNSQQSNISQMALNKDVITWDPYQDSLGNELNDVNLRVDIQAASIDYEANTKSDLLNQTINDMLTGNWSDLITISPNVGEYSFTWETVARALFGSNYTANWWNNLFNVFDSAQGVFYKKGWIYRIRLRTYDDSYVGDWQIIYNITSAPPSDSEKVYNNYYVYNYTIPDEETYRVINNINTMNNTTNNWYQNDVPFNPDSGSNWFEKLLEFISELIQKILDFFSNIFDGLVDLILGLFDNVNPAESFFNWFNDLFNGIHDIDLTLPQFNIPNEDLTSFNRLVQETLNIFSFNNFGFVIFIPLLLIIIKAVF